MQCHAYEEHLWGLGQKLAGFWSSLGRYPRGPLNA
jgi:hypothetical protein